LCVVHDETTFKGFYLCKTKKMFDSTSGQPGKYEDYPFYNKIELLVGITSYITNDHKHHNLTFMFASRNQESDEIKVKRPSPISYCVSPDSSDYDS
jgi:hypothetical protein